jgi:hypothetical protein
MRRASGWGVVVLVLAPAIWAQGPEKLSPPSGKVADDKLLQDLWDAAYLDGHPTGFVRLKVEEVVRPDGQKVIRSTQEMNLSVRRGGDIANVHAITGTDETENGTVIGVFMRQMLGKNVSQDLRGTVKGNQLETKAVGQSNFEKPIPWDPRVLSARGEQELLRKRNPPPKPGDKFDYLTYNPLINRVVTVHVVVEGQEPVVINSAPKPERLSLLRVSMVPDNIENVPMPSQLVWYDGSLEIRKTLANMPGFGFLTTERSTQQIARQQIQRDQLPDIMDRNSIKLAQRIANAHGASTLDLRVRLKDAEPGKTFAQDRRQSVTNVKDDTFELHISAIREPAAKMPAGAKSPGPEYLSSNFFITSGDSLVQKHAATAVGAETDPWKKSRMVERWVHHNMKVQNFTEAMAPAYEVARTLTGDCTEYSMLAAAMCRAAGVPSRTAIGLIYVDPPRPRPAFFGFHMWTEVWINGDWIAIDATLGQGGIGPAHLKIADQSWHETTSMTPLLPLMRVIMAQPAIEVMAPPRRPAASPR